MIIAGITRPLTSFLIFLIAAPAGLAQLPQPPARTSPDLTGPPLHLVVLEGNNVVNSIPLLRSVAPVVEVRDQNEFPVEGAAVVFTLPEQGAGGTFAAGGSRYTTRTDSHGQATTPPIVPRTPGKYTLNVSATSGNSKGEVTINQTNSTGDYVGPVIPEKVWYKKRRTWILAGGAVAAAVIVIAVHGSGSSSSPTSVVVTPGPPVFH